MEAKNSKKELKALCFLVKTDAFNLLTYGKTPKYEDRFKSWARNTNSEHLTNLVDAMLSSTAFAMVTGKAITIAPNVSVDFLRGQTNGILMMREFIRTYASDTNQETDEVDEYNTLSDLLG